MSLFSGLDKFGLGKLEKMDVFEEEHKKEEGGKLCGRKVCKNGAGNPGLYGRER